MNFKHSYSSLDNDIYLPNILDSSPRLDIESIILEWLYDHNQMHISH